MLIVPRMGYGGTYSSQSDHLSRALSSHLLGHTVEVKDKRGESLSVVALPLANRIHILDFDRLSCRLAFLLSGSYQFLLKSTGNGIVGAASKQFRVRVLCVVGGGRPAGLVVHSFHHLFLGWRLAVRDFHLG